MVLNIFTLLGGLGIFLYSIDLFCSKIFINNKDNIKILPKNLTNTKAFCGGIFSTVLAQSSTMISIITMNCADKNLIKLKFCYLILIGANIGTTFTSQISAFSNINLIIYAFPILFLLYFLKNIKKISIICEKLLILCFIFVGLYLMQNSALNLSQFYKLPNIENNFLLCILGFALTALLTSSSATSSLLVTLGSASLISFSDATYVILGINIGATVITSIASLSKGTNANKIALFNIIFNILGSILFFILLTFIDFSPIFCTLFKKLNIQIAMFHTFYNLITAMFAILILNPLIKLIDFIYKK